jgi:hypothetical protein
MSIYFLMCSERSGSNFITKLLNGHRDVCGPSPKHIINPVARNLFRYKDLSDRSNWNELLKDIHHLINIDFSIWKKNFTLNDLKELSEIGDVQSLIKNIFMEEAKQNGKKNVFIKENHIYEFLPFLLLNFPLAKYIYLVRDPRDMALSWKKSAVHPGGVINAARQWQKDQQKTLKDYNELKKNKMAYILKYENLISDIDTYTKEMISFLELEWDDNITNFHEDKLTQKNASRQEAWSNLSKTVLINNKDKYLKELSEHEIIAIEKICYYEMVHLGYEPIYAKSVLDKFIDDEVEKINEKEYETKGYNINDGVKNNMQAKEVFYHKIIKS